MKLPSTTPSPPSLSQSSKRLIEIRNGDAFDLFDELPPLSVDLIVTSPPYWGHRSYLQSHDWRRFHRMAKSLPCPSYADYRKAGGVLGLEPTPDWFVSHLTEIVDKSARVLKPAGSLWVNLGDTYFARWSSVRPNGRQGLGDSERDRRVVPMGGYRQEKQLLLIPSRFAIAMQERRWILRNDLIWFKPNVPPRPERDRLKLSHEHFFHFVKRPSSGRAKYFYDLEMAEPGGLDVVRCPVRPSKEGHSATFPPGIIEPRILSSCPLGGTVLDPFAGTGTVLHLAAGKGRRAIGFEISKQYVSVIQKRLKS